MLRRIATLLLLPFALSSCSYIYDVLAVVRDGRLVFIVDPASSQQPSCLRRIEVTAEEGTMWLESVSHDDKCANKFPLPYGVTLKGQHQQDSELIGAKPLRRGTVYEISTTSGATGYGGGRFAVRADGSIENLKFQQSAAQSNEASQR